MRKNTTLAAIAIGLVAASGAHAAFLTPVGATASSEFNGADPGTRAVNTINGLGLSVNSPAGTHDNNPDAETMWHSQVLASPADAANEFITFDLGAPYDLTGAYIWNFNQLSGDNNATARGVQGFDLLTSPDNSTFATAISGGTLAQAGGSNAEPAQFVPFTAAAARYVTIDVNSNFDGPFNNVVGLSEVRFQGTAVPEPAALGLLGLGGLALLRRRRAV